MPWMSLPWSDPRNNALREKFGILGVPVLIILDAQTGITVTPTARKDIKRDVHETYATWEKLLNLRKQQAVERAELDAQSAAQRKEREWREKQKKEANKAIAEEPQVQGEVM